MNPFASALVFGLTAVRGFAGDPAIYDTGAAQIAITAVLGKSELPLVVDDIVAETVTTADFLVAAADLKVNGVPFLPKSGHKITQNGETFEVVSIPGHQPFDYSDQGGSTLRIHTQRTS